VMSRDLLRFGESDRSAFATRPLVSRHVMHELPLWDDDELVALLDAYPRDRLQAFTMGTDPSRREEWRYVDASRASGREIFAAVSRGRLWLNLLRVDLADRRYGDMVRRLTRELQAECPAVGLLSINFATLLISSPGAIVYYHFDASHQALWHMSGSKRIWLYPACDPRFAPAEIMEDIFAGAYDYDEELPYSRDFDAHAQVFDLRSGDVVSWPQNAPHRIENLGTVNVSLSTGFITAAAERRSLIYAANRLLRRRFGLRVRSTGETGVVASAKCIAYRAVRRAGLVRQSVDRAYPRTLVVDCGAPLGYRRAEG